MAPALPAAHCHAGATLSGGVRVILLPSPTSPRPAHFRTTATVAAVPPHASRPWRGNHHIQLPCP